MPPRIPESCDSMMSKAVTSYSRRMVETPYHRPYNLSRNRGLQSSVPFPNSSQKSSIMFLSSLSSSPHITVWATSTWCVHHVTLIKDAAIFQKGPKDTEKDKNSSAKLGCT